MKNSADDAARTAVLARLAESRAQIEHILEAPPAEAGEEEEDAAGGFPRSRTMRALLSGKGLGAVGATAAGLLLARPALVWRLIQLVPKGAMMRILALKLTEALRPKSAPRP